jgi:branched-chain amino acid transport system permease protein
MAQMAQLKQTQAEEGVGSINFVIRMGLLAGVIGLYVATIGMIVAFSERKIVADLLTLGQVLLIAPSLGMGFYVANKQARSSSPGKMLLSGALVGVLATLPLWGLIILAEYTNIREMFVNISPALVDVLTFGQANLVVGGLILLVVMAISGVVGAGLRLLPERWRKAVIWGLGVTLAIALMSDLLIVILRPLLGSAFVRLLFQGGLAWYTAVAIFLITFGLSLFWQSRGELLQTRYRTATAPYQREVRYGSISIGGIILLLLPWILGTFLSEVLDNVGLYILMALGLNMAVGLAGLLDLGYVANFAVGAYVAAIFTTTGDQGIGQLSFWLVIPLSIIAAMITGFLLALPVLRMRGDYLAITTLGFGEIIRVLVLSDWLAPYIGGTQGVQNIPNPSIFGFEFSRPEHFYYLILLGCMAALFVSVRLNNSRTGRQWMALREDEDVAAAMGIDTVLTKLLAFTLSAATGGLAGAIFAAKLSTTFPQSFTLLVSINVLSIIIVGGMGSIPGIVLGAFLLIGAPELLREFQEYRLLIYGALLILVMLLRPEGLWPSAVRRRELHDVMDEAAAMGVAHSEVISHGQTVEARRMD